MGSLQSGSVAPDPVDIATDRLAGEDQQGEAPAVEHDGEDQAELQDVAWCRPSAARTRAVTAAVSSSPSAVMTTRSGCLEQSVAGIRVG